MADDGFVPRAVASADDGFIPRKVTPPPWKGDTHGVVTGAALDYLGLTDRPDAHTDMRLIHKPEGAERLIFPAIASPLIYAGGLAAGAGATAAGVPASVAAFAPAAGRVLTTGGISAAKGEDAWHTAIDMIGATIGEGAGAVVGKAAAPIAKAAESLHEIRDRISAGASGAVNTRLLDMFVQRIKSAPNDVAREAAVKNAVEQLNQMGQGLGTMFRRFVVNARASLPFVRSVSAKVPMGASSAAGGVRDVAANPAVRSVIDAALGAPPMSAVATSAMLRHADRIPGVKEVVETAEGEP